MNTKELYFSLAENIPQNKILRDSFSGPLWAYAETEDSCAVAMAMEGSSVPKRMEAALAGKFIKELAPLVESWNLQEASLALAAVNSCYNTNDRLLELQCYLSPETHFSETIDFFGKKVAVVGHMSHSIHAARKSASEVYVLERSPHAGDYPDSACEWILPQCDIVIITGSALINKTLPRLLELSENAFTILTGPSVPLCPALFAYGVDMLSGFVPQSREELRAFAKDGGSSGISPFGKPFLLRR